MKIHQVLTICILAGSLTGCVTYVHDSKLKELKPAKAELKDFAGTFNDFATYFTPPNVIGLEGHETLGSALRGLDYNSSVQIEITSTEDIVVKSRHDKFALAPLHYIKGKNFDFTNNCVVFRSESHFGGNDLPGFGASKTSMTWMLDDSANLVVLSSGYGAGFATIIPLVVSDSTFSVFPRIK